MTHSVKDAPGAANWICSTRKCAAFVQQAWLRCITVYYGGSRTAKSFPGSSPYVELTVRMQFITITAMASKHREQDK